MRVKGKDQSRSRSVEATTSADDLLSAFSYCEHSGLISHKGSGKPTATSGGRYGQVWYRETFLSAHRVIWCMMTGAWPTDEVDHKDGNSRNNAWSNLREATPQMNSRWARAKTGRTSERGVTTRPCGKFRVRIGMGRRGCRLSIGDFATLEEAKAARAQAEAKHWPIPASLTFGVGIVPATKFAALAMVPQ
jgi:hypothetical protein